MLILMPPCAPDLAHAERLLFLAFWCIVRMDVIVVGMAGCGLAAEVEPAAS